jgi:hypothetical protein
MSTIFQTVGLVWAMMLCSSTRVDVVLARFLEVRYLLPGCRCWIVVQHLGTDDRGSIGAVLSTCSVGAQGMLPSLHDRSVVEFEALVPFPDASRH